MRERNGLKIYTRLHSPDHCPSRQSTDCRSRFVTDARRSEYGSRSQIVLRCKMSNSPEIFVSTMHRDFNWPYAKPPKPPSPPMDTIGVQPYLLKSDPEDCKCDVHGLKTGKARYRQLANKERRLYDELIKVNREMTELISSMLDSGCDVEETMKSVYKTDYEKRGLPVTQYRPLMAAIDSPLGLPITSTIINLKDARKDPTKFKTSAIEPNSSTCQDDKTVKR
ncbi:uncharacterized protein LOC105197722 [Solenopsis invicta]|uniref:uncharacterized protein LOC105197722 n=1 Tax=Solenopsis invicta TaxID=13686 RepID=UPI00193E9000|nr:uncharacterized protein LOC105197722 [Solenopsis invicta]